MALIEEIFSIMKGYLPIKISEVQIYGDTIHLIGDNCSFKINCAWRLSEKDRVVFACCDRDAHASIVSVVGLSIVKIIGSQSNSLDLDPILKLSNDQYLEIFSNSTSKGWVFSRFNKTICSSVDIL